ncbi:putative disease resistance protein RGA3 [Silene latifolia]|uniref:putative disease resistance protein RGA3 n=1 Tax=Silene latifolia TaxID=37657 RepID=UPI003D7784B7
MAESILFNIVEKILVSLSQHAFQGVVSCWGAKQDLEKLEDTLRFIRARVHNAERRHEEDSSQVIKDWVGDEEPISRLVVERETISFVQADIVIGRDGDKNNILDMLFDPKHAEDGVSVIPIVGFGGLGKTTLAQLKKVQGEISKALIDESYHDLSREQIQSKIRIAVKDKKFLLVLDDIWDDSPDRWEILFGLLQCGNRGSKIIVTTRSDVVAAIVGIIPKAYKLGLLTKEESWTLFKMLAFKHGQEESCPTLAQIGKEIVGNCGNVPLAIRVVGSLLYSKPTEKEWELFRDAQHSRRQRFNSNELVRLWMAQGYIEMEDVGDQYFLELVRRNLFQDVEKYDIREVIRCKMHDLVHDLAQLVAGDESSVIDGFTNRLVHVNFDDNAHYGPKSLLVAKSLRSLLLGNDNSPESLKEVLRFRSLRALKFSKIKVVPDSINRLTHLRYLNLSESLIESLPTGITRLDNLKTLNLDYCSELKELPTGFTKLVNLRHLGIQACAFTEMPPHFGRLKSLRELTRFIVGQNNGLDTLGDLNLRGRLEIEFRRWRTNTVLEAQVINLKEKKQLTSLSFCFEYEGDQPAVATKDELLLLESLHLPPTLKYELPKLVEIRIRACDSCQALPLFSRLPLLKFLYFEELEALEYIEVDDVMISNEAFFPVLETLWLHNMQELKRWSKVEEEASLHLGQCYIFPRLRTLWITRCRKLMTLPFMPQLESFSVRDIHEELLKSILTSSSSTSSPPTL